MLHGQVIGTATTTIKHPSLEGWRLLVVQPCAADGKSADGDPVLAIDHLGADQGSWVLLTSDGRGVRELVQNDNTPVRWSILGICDE